MWGSLRAFAPAWRDLARWSALGVVTTEASANAHAYLVTFIAGPEAFALLAVGALFMRPVSLVLFAIPDAERPAMARAMSQNNVSAAVRTLTQFRMAGLAVLSGAVILSAVIMIWFPQLVMKHGYDKASVVAVIGIWILVMTTRAIRTPESVFLQVVGEYRTLAGASMRASVVSMLATLILLLTCGPVVSLLGILFGELVASQRIFSLTRAWRAQHA
jgi:O-antigen/teichoic acid export membrane protein